MDVPVAEPQVETPPTPPPLWPGFVTLLLSMVALLGGGALIGIALLLESARRGEKLDALAIVTTPAGILASAAVSQLALLVSVVVLPRLFKDTPLGWPARVRWVTARLHPLRVVVAWLGTLAVGSLATTLLEPLRTKSDILSRFGDVARDAPLPIFVALLFFGAVMPGVGEELMFRGLLQSRLEQRWKVLPSILLTAALFGAYHLDLRQGLAAMAMGWWLGWLAWRDGSVVNVAIGHMLNNATAFMLSRFAPTSEDVERSPLVIGISVGVVLVCIACGTWLTKKKETT